MDPLTMMTLASAAIGGLKGAKDAKKNGGNPVGAFLSGALDGATSGGAGPFSSMFGGGGPSIGNGGAGIQLPRTNFGQFGSLTPYL